MAKSSEAFRTISEVSDWLETPAHVLRFWESRFSQIKPVKRAGGRRYYRPGDMALLGGIKRLLHEDGITIKGVQKILREKGVKYVGSLNLESLGSSDSAKLDADIAASSEQTPIVGILAETTTLDAPVDMPVDTGDDLEPDYVEPIIFAAATPSEPPKPEPQPTPEPSPQTAHAPLDQDGEHPAHRVTPGGDITRPTAQPVATGHEDRITALYSRLAALRDRVRRDMVNG
jgi:DNA-binding transcriptional MerR regulator